MGQPVIQTSFNSGEWSPKLYARVDLAKYHSGAALLKNFFVDYRGGATTRPGSRYVLQAKSNLTVRVIPFQASLGVTYALEFGQGYIRFYNNGAAVLESAKSITSAAVGPPEVFTSTGHGYANGDWLSISGNCYIVANATTNTFTLTDLFGNAINTNPFSLPINAQRIYTVTSPYQSGDIRQIKYAQNVNQLILCHPSYPPYVLTLNTTQVQPNWSLAAITFGATIAAPTFASATITTASAGATAWVSYVATAVDANGQESAPSIPTTINTTFFGVNYTVTLTLNATAGAKSYNLYKSITSLTATLPAGTQFGFIGNITGTVFIDSNIGPNFGVGPPIVQNPFSGAGLASATANAAGGNYTQVPNVTLTGGSPTSPGLVTATMTTLAYGLSAGGFNYHVGDVLHDQYGYGVNIQVTSTTGPGTVAGFTVLAAGLNSTTGASLQTTVGMLGGAGSGCQIGLNWGLYSLSIVYAGAGYLSAPSVGFINGGSGSGAVGTVTIGGSSAGNPTVPAIIQQRLFLGGLAQGPSQFNLSQPGAYFNFNTTFPAEADNAISATLNGVTLNTIKSAIAVSAGLLIFTDKGAWLLNGGSAGSGLSALGLVANAQAYSGASDLPPIVTPNDILYVQSKGSIVRDLAYNFYLANYVGADISVLSSHLFYTYTLIDWAWAEEPFKLAWAVRSDGALLSLTFIKDQELIGWTQHATLGGYQSVCSIPESTTTAGIVDAVYTVVQRNVQGQLVNYIERFAELAYPNDYKSSWQVDAGIGYNGAAATTFSGAQHLGGQVVTGLADGVPINFTMPTSGTFVFGPGGTAGLTGIANASIVTVGLQFTPQLTTLPLDLGEPTDQGKRKKISAVSLKLSQTLGLIMGSGTVDNSANFQPLQDLILGNLNEYSNATVTGLVTGMSRGFLDPDWNVPGQYTIVQNLPYPASILGVVPEIVLGDTAK